MEGLSQVWFPNIEDNSRIVGTDRLALINREPYGGIVSTCGSRTRLKRTPVRDRIITPPGSGFTCKNPERMSEVNGGMAPRYWRPACEVPMDRKTNLRTTGIDSAYADL